MAKRTPRNNNQNKEQLKAIVDELKANKIQSTEESVKLQTVMELFADGCRFNGKYKI